MRKSYARSRCLLGACLIFLAACGAEVTWFVSFNTGPIDPNGLVVIIGTPAEETPKSVRVVEGELPKGMKLQADGTVQGVPEGEGAFDFTLELTDAEGHVEQKNYHGEIKDLDET